MSARESFEFCASISAFPALISTGNFNIQLLTSTMSISPPSIFLSPSTERLPTASVSLLPFQINYDGPAKISTYFSTRPRISTSIFGLKSIKARVSALSRIVLGQEKEEVPAELEASFRGRLLLSTPFVVPQNYVGLVFSTTTPAPTAPTVSKVEKLEERVIKKVKLSTAEDRKGKGKSLITVPDGRRRSPRKKATPRVVFSMDSSDEEGEKDNMNTKVEPEEIAPISEVEKESVPTREPEIEMEIEMYPAILSQNSPVPPETPIESQQTSPPTEMDPLARDTQTLIPHSTFNFFQIFNADVELDPIEDVYARGVLEWIEIADKES